MEQGVKGGWPKQEWVPSLIASAKYMGCVPGDMGPVGVVDWVPVDVLGRVIAELCCGDNVEGKAAFYHIQNPKGKTWKELMPSLVEGLQQNVEKGIEVVDLKTWVDKLEVCAADENVDLERNPAVKLLPFFQDLRDRAIYFPKARSVILDTKNTIKKTPTLASLAAVKEEWLDLWMKQWNFA